MGILVFLAWLGASQDYVATVERFRHQRQERVFGQDGWSRVAGLFFLKEGANRIGHAAQSEVRLPEGPEDAGEVVVQGETVRLVPAPGVRMEAQEGPLAAPRDIKADTSGTDIVRLGPLAFQLLKRNGRFAIRLWNNGAQERKGRLDWFPIQESYRVTATFHPGPKTIPVATILGYTEAMASPGYVTFRLQGSEVRLDPVFEEPGAKEFFFLFRDLTAGKSTYPAGRFLYAGLPADGTLILDFNQAFAPPCAFTRFATCPIPPKQNQLPVSIEAGERGLGRE